MGNLLFFLISWCTNMCQQEVSHLDRGNLLQAKSEGFLELLKIVKIIYNSKILHGSLIFDI